MTRPSGETLAVSPFGCSGALRDSGRNPVDDEVHAALIPLVHHVVRARIIDFPQLSFLHDTRFSADREYNLIVGRDGRVDTACVHEWVSRIDVDGDGAVCFEANEQGPSDVVVAGIVIGDRLDHGRQEFVAV